MKRNIGMHTSAESARKNIIAYLLRVAPNYGHRGALKSQLGFSAFPDYDFKTPQGAAFSVAKIVRKMERDQLIAQKFSEFDRGFYLTSAGRLEAAA